MQNFERPLPYMNFHLFNLFYLFSFPLCPLRLSGAIALALDLIKRTNMIVAQSDRLYFKQFCPKDVEGFYQLNNNIENIRFTGDKPFASREQTLEFIENYDHYRRHGFGRWSLYLKENNQYVGFCGLRFTEQTGEVDIGYRIDQRFWGLGLASEATHIALDLGFSHYGLELITSRAREDNPASSRVLIKNGFTETGFEIEDGHKWLMFALEKMEYFIRQQD